MKTFIINFNIIIDTKFTYLCNLFRINCLETDVILLIILLI